MPDDLRHSISITDIPEALAIARREIARVLREYADEMDGPASAEELRRLADIFETGQFRE